MIGNVIAGMFAGGAVVGDFESIATVSVGSGGSATIQFTSIPSTYQHLQLRYIVRTTQNAPGYDYVSAYITFNSDTASNYSYHELSGQGTVASALSGTSQTSIVTYATLDNITANIYAAAFMDILDYKDTNKYKTTRSINGWDKNGAGYVTLISGNWRSTSAISSLTITPYSGNFKQYSHFALYGIKG